LRRKATSGEAIPAICEGVACFGGRIADYTGISGKQGGVPPNDVLNSGLALRTTRVRERILQGCSVVRCPHDHPRYPDMQWGIYPGDVGGSGFGNGLSTAQWGG